MGSTKFPKFKHWNHWRKYTIYRLQPRKNTHEVTFRLIGTQVRFQQRLFDWLLVTKHILVLMLYNLIFYCLMNYFFISVHLHIKISKQNICSQEFYHLISVIHYLQMCVMLILNTNSIYSYFIAFEVCTQSWCSAMESFWFKF